MARRFVGVFVLLFVFTTGCGGDEELLWQSSGMSGKGEAYAVSGHEAICSVNLNPNPDGKWVCYYDNPYKEELCDGPNEAEDPTVSGKWHGERCDYDRQCSQPGRWYGQCVGSPGKARCNVNMVRWSGKTGVSVEDDYLPRVVYCEVGVYRKYANLLSAVAIAARTFMHGRLTMGGLDGRTNDQVYFGRHCNHPLKPRPVPQVFIDAVHGTRGLVMQRDDGTERLHRGYYRQGVSSYCETYRRCDGEPCLGHREAAGCARLGFSRDGILHKFYGRLTVEQTPGSCTRPPVDNPNPDACYDNGREGTCQATNEHCDGYISEIGSCSSSSKQCCLPFKEGEGDPCFIDGQGGTCQNIIFTTCDSGFRPSPTHLATPYCPGNWEVQCCLDNAALPPAPPPEPEQVEEPAFRWIGDECTDDTQCTVSGVWTKGKCRNGFCTQSCSRYCPDLQEGLKLVTGPFTRLIKPATFCVPLEGEGRCVSRRDYTYFSKGCPSGTTDCEVGRYSRPNFKRNACIPNELFPQDGGCEALFGGSGKSDDFGESLGGPPTPEGDALDFKQDDSGCSLNPAPTAALPWLLVLMLRPRRRR